MGRNYCLRPANDMQDLHCKPFGNLCLINIKLKIVLNFNFKHRPYGSNILPYTVTWNH